MTQWQKVSQEVARNAIAAALSHMVGRDKTYSFSRAQSLLGCSEGSLKNWLAARTAPQHHEFMQMCVVFGPVFVNAHLAALNMTGARMADDGDQCARVLQTAVARLGADLAAALEDGHVDHIERAKILPLARDVRHSTERYVQGGPRV